MLEVRTEIAMACLKLNAQYVHQDIQPIPVGDGLYWLKVDGELLDGMAMTPNEVFAALGLYAKGLEKVALVVDNDPPRWWTHGDHCWKGIKMPNYKHLEDLWGPCCESHNE